MATPNAVAGEDPEHVPGPTAATEMALASASGDGFGEGQARVWLTIRCPACEWQPAPHDAWNCNPGGCGHSWNTFETRGVCPAYSRGWTETACLRCSVWSPHDDWYVEKE
jgi:hypothetical protein